MLPRGETVIIQTRGGAFIDDFAQTFTNSTVRSEEDKKDTECLRKQVQFLPLSLSQCDHGHDLLCLCKLLLLAMGAAILI